MPAPLMAAVATTWIREGRAETLLGAVRAEARARRALAARILPAASGPAESLHVWLPLPRDVSPERLRQTAHRRGLALVTQEAFAVSPTRQPACACRWAARGGARCSRARLANLAELLDASQPGAGAVVPGPNRVVGRDSWLMNDR